MDANKLTPDNDSTGKLKQSHVVGSILLITDQEFNVIQSFLQQFNVAGIRCSQK